MSTVTSFSDKFLIKAASSYVYDMSSFNLYKDPILTVTLNVNKDFLFKYRIEHFENKAFERDGKRINLRYLLFEDVKTHEHALIFQGSDGDMFEMFSGLDNDWSDNLNTVAHLPQDNFDLALEEFEYLKNIKGYNITAVSGNSLGGGYALHLADKYPSVRLIGLNPAPRAFGTHFYDSGNSTILLTSSDILSKLTLVDKSRFEGKENESKIDKLASVYGYKPVMINRSIPYTNEANLSIGHVGANQTHRKVIEKLYNENALYYNAKIIASSQERLGFSKHLIKTQYQKLEQKEYVDYIDNHVYPALSDNAKKQVDTYRYYPNLDEFIQFDIQTLNLKPNSYKIEDTKDFIDKLNMSIEDLNVSQTFFINNSLALLESLDEESPFGYTKKTFLSQNLKLKIDWDWSVIKAFIDMPLSVKVKLGELVEKNWYFFFQLGNQINNEYQNREVLSDHDSLVYILDLIKALNIYSAQYNELINVLCRMSSNIEMMLIKKESYFFDDTLLQSPGVFKEASISDLELLKTKMMSSQFNQSKDALKNSKDYIESNIEVLSQSSIEIFDEIINSLKQSVSKNDNVAERKLLKQCEAIRENIDFKSLLTLLLIEFQDDIAILLLSGSVAMDVYGNIIQSKELLIQVDNRINNLLLYSKENLGFKDQEYLKDDFELLEKLVTNLKDILDFISE